MSLDDVLRAGEERIEQMHRFQPGRTALLVVDMQRGFLDEGAALEVPPGREIVPNVRRLIDTCREKDVPVVFTEFVYSTALPCLRGDPFGREHLPADGLDGAVPEPYRHMTADEGRVIVEASRRIQRPLDLARRQHAHLQLSGSE